MLRPATDLENVKIGTSVVVDLNLYCSVGIPWITAVPWLLPNSVLSDMAELRIKINCSAQLVFVGSFHLTVCCAKSRPLLSTIDSVVVTELNLSRPLAAMFLLALYPNILAIRRMLSFLSASSIKFSLLARSNLKDKLWPRNAIASISARYSELSI